MAVFQGARVRTVALPSPRIGAGRRADVPTEGGSAHRVRPVGLLLASILTATLIGLVYLTQTLASNAASAELVSLEASQEALDQTLRNQVWAVQEVLAPGAMARRARDLGLVKLDDAVVLPVP